MLGFYRDNGKHNENYYTIISILGFIGIMEKNMETTTVYWVFVGRMEKKMQTTTACLVFIEVMEKKMITTTLFWFVRDNGKDNGNYYSILGLYRA